MARLALLFGSLASASALRPTRRTWLARCLRTARRRRRAGGRGVGRVHARRRRAEPEGPWRVALGHRLGRRLVNFDAADPSCVTDGGTGEFARRMPARNLRAAVWRTSAAVVLVSTGNDEGLLRVGLYSETPVAAVALRPVIRAPIKPCRRGRRRCVEVYTWRVIKPCSVSCRSPVLQPQAGLPPADSSRKTPADFLASTPKKIKPAAPPSVLPAVGSPYLRTGPGPGFALSFAPSDGKGRCAVGSLLDDASMKLLARDWVSCQSSHRERRHWEARQAALRQGPDRRTLSFDNTPSGFSARTAGPVASRPARLSSRRTAGSMVFFFLRETPFFFFRFASASCLCKSAISASTSSSVNSGLGP